MNNQNQNQETSIAIYLINGAVALLISTVAYFNGPDMAVVMGFFVLMLLTSLFYNYKVCILTAICCIASYALVINYLVTRQEIVYPKIDIIVQLIYFLSASSIVCWLTFKIQKKIIFTPFISSKGYLKTVLDSLEDGIIILDRNQKIAFFSKSAEKLLQIKGEEAVKNQEITDLTQPPYQSLYKVLTVGSEKGEKGENQNVEVKINSPKPTVLEVSTIPITQRGELLGTLKIIKNITQTKALDKTKTELISIILHHLRTPLSAVKWSIKMLIDGDMGAISAEQRDILTKGYRANERMIHLVNDLLNVSKIEEGRFQYKLVPASISELVETTIQEFTYSLEEKGIGLKFDKPKTPVSQVMMDPMKIHVVLQNLINNAISYTQNGGEIEIKIKNHPGAVEVSIKDNGMGIPAEQQTSLFQKFFRANNAMRLQTEGSGLGLYIARDIIENHHGRIWAESEENKGSVFFFTLPVNQ